jgi:sulfide:quinone oxidoreductase
MASEQDPLNLVIVGGGVAALETLIALRELAGDRVAMTLVAPEHDFVYRPLTVAEPFARGEARRYGLAEIAHEFGARFVPDALAALDAEARTVTTERGESLQYDVLVLGVGARQVPAFRRALTFGVERDPEMFNGLLADIEQGYARRVAFVVPAGVSWPLPLYELALMTAAQAAGMGIEGLDFTLVTPEDHPLAIFGPAVSTAVGELLGQAGITPRTAVYPRESGDDIVLEPGGIVLSADRVVALPRLEGPGLAGVPSDPAGFIPTELDGRVTGVNDVYAAGDATTFPIKQGGIATQQADAIAESIAARAGAEIEPRPFRPVLRGMLLTGGGARYMRAAVAGGGGEGAVSGHTLWWPPTKIAGRYLAPYLARRDEGELSPPTEQAEGALAVEAPIEPAGEHGRRRWIISHGQGDDGIEVVVEETTSRGGSASGGEPGGAGRSGSGEAERSERHHR